MAVGHDRGAPDAEGFGLHGLLENRIDLPMVEVALVVPGTLDVLAFADQPADAVGFRLGKAVGIDLDGRILFTVHRIKLGLNHFVKGSCCPAGSDDFGIGDGGRLHCSRLCRRSRLSER